jgi:hypothetical protein
MPTFLGLTALFLLATEVLQWDLTITTGLSAKNAVIYLVASLLVLRMIVARTNVFVVQSMHGAWLMLIGYALVTWLLAGLVIVYPHYDFRESMIALKVQLIDNYIFFLVFLYAVTEAEDCMKVIKGLLLGAVFANAATILDYVGVIDLGLRIRPDGRAQGALGESNQYAAFIVLFIPGMIAATVSSRGLQRLFWLGASLLSCGALVMTASRGAFVGVLITGAVGLYLYRHLISYSRVSGWFLGALILFVLVMSTSQYGALLSERIIGQSSSIDANEASSGRTEIWAELLTTMMKQPVTFITGYGWNVYNSMPFNFSPHNHYLALWFNLGLLGLVAGGALLFGAIRRARQASFRAQPPLRGQLIAYVLGTTALTTAVFFVDLHKPWIYFWMYSGVAMRLALAVNEAPAPIQVESVVRKPVRVAPKDPWGWVVRPGGRAS